MSRTFEEQLEGSEFANDAEFLLCFERMIADNPHRHPSDLLFIAESTWRTQLKCASAIAQIRRDAAMEERLRIAEIIRRGAIGGTANDVSAAIELALTSDLSPDDAVAILAARDSAAPLKPS